MAGPVQSASRSHTGLVLEACASKLTSDKYPTAFDAPQSFFARSGTSRPTILCMSQGQTRGCPTDARHIAQVGVAITVAVFLLVVPCLPLVDQQSTRAQATVLARPGGDAGALVPANANSLLGWQLPAVDLDAFGPNAVDQDLVVDSRGVVTAVWRLAEGPVDVVQAARLVEGVWSAPVDLSDRAERAFNTRIVVDGFGHVTAVWRVLTEGSQGGAYKSSRYANGSWTEPVTISAPGVEADVADMTIDRSGVVTVAWGVVPNGGIQAVRYRAGAWGTPVNISAPGRMGEPALAADPAGVVTAVWEVNNSTRGSSGSIQASRFVNDTWTAPSEVSSPVNWPAAVYDSRVVVDEDGMATAVWVHHNGSTSSIEMASLNGQSWTTPQTLSPPGGSCYTPQMVVDRAGNVTAMWSVSDDTSGLAGLQAVRKVGGEWQPHTDVVNRDFRRSNAWGMVVDSAGVVTVMLSMYDGLDGRLYSSRFADGQWNLSEPLSPLGVDASTTQIATGPRDQLFVIWRQRYYLGGVLRFLRYVAYPPPSIQVSCRYSAANGRGRFDCRGLTTGIEPGQRLTAFVRFPGSTSWSEAGRRAEASVQADGKFSVVFSAKKRGTYRIYFANDETVSNIVTVRRR